MVGYVCGRGDVVAERGVGEYDVILVEFLLGRV